MRQGWFYRPVMTVVTLLVLAGSLQAATLHFIVFAETLDPDIGTIEDLERAQTWAQEIATYADLDLSFQSLSGRNLTVANARTMLRGVEAGTDDVIYFFYSGHGGNPGDRKWPVLYFLSSSSSQTPVSFDEVVEVLQPKSPRMLMILADCRNSYPWQTAHQAPRDGVKPAFDYSDAFKNLFVDFRGTVLASGCAPGQFSLGITGQGGLFINCFMDSVYTTAEAGGTPTWDEVLSLTQESTAESALLYDEIHQEPQYVIEGGLVADHTPDDLNLDDPEDQIGDGALTDDEPAPETSTTEDNSQGDVLAAPSCGTMGGLPLVLAAGMLPIMGYRRRRR